MPVFQWCQPKLFLEGTAKDAFAGKACTEADVLYRKFGILQQIFRGVQADVYQVFMGRKAGFFSKAADKVVGA